MKEQDVDKLFREGLENHETAPSAAMWDKIAKQLDQEQDGNVIGLGSARKKKATGWIRYASAACAVIGLGLFAYLSNRDSGDVSRTVAMVTQQNVKKPSGDTSSSASFLDSAESEEAGKTAENVSDDSNQVLAAHTTAADPTHSDLSTNNKVAKRGVHTNGQTSEKHIQPAYVAMSQEESTAETMEAPAVLPLQLAEVPAVELPTRYVTEVEPIKPIVEPFEEEEDMMIAETVRKATNSVIHKIIHVVSDSTPAQIGKEVIVSKDEEGSFRLELGTLFAKNRIRKRK